MARMTDSDFVSQAVDVVPAFSAAGVFTGSTMPSVTEPLSRLVQQGPAAGLRSLLGYTVPAAINQNLVGPITTLRDEGTPEALRQFLRIPEAKFTPLEKGDQELIKLKTLIGLEE
jgi:hypothetical protein